MLHKRMKCFNEQPTSKNDKNVNSKEKEKRKY